MFERSHAIGRTNRAIPSRASHKPVPVGNEKSSDRASIYVKRENDVMERPLRSEPSRAGCPGLIDSERLELGGVVRPILPHQRKADLHGIAQSTGYHVIIH